jgi:hypothetical protein
MDELIDEHDEPADEPHKPTELTDIYCLSCNQRRLKALFDGRFMCYICRDKKKRSVRQKRDKGKAYQAFRKELALHL